MTTTAAEHRHDRSDRAWAILEPSPRQAGQSGTPRPEQPPLQHRRIR